MEKLERRNYVKKIIFFILFIGLLSTIFYFSSQTYQQQSLIPLLDSILPKDWIIQHFSFVHFHYGSSEISIQSRGVSHFVEFFIRKAAHFCVYATLAIIAFFIIRMWKSNVFSSILSITLCFLYASSDEIHQHFTGGRTPMWQDVVLDTFGVCVGVMLTIFITHFKRKKA
jgi:VanZ family protein